MYTRAASMGPLLGRSLLLVLIEVVRVGANVLNLDIVTYQDLVALVIQQVIVDVLLVALVGI